MLLHYFGSKERLIAEVMELVHERFQSVFRDVTDSRTARDPMILRRFWRALSARKNRPLIRLLFEVQVLALQNPSRYRGYLTGTSAAWRRLIEQALPAGQGNAATATLYAAVVDGLLLELLATGDLRRTSRALEAFDPRCAADALRSRRKQR